MKKILLTSTGFENKNFEKLFLDNIAKEASEIKVIFVPTAAIEEDAKAMLPKCMNDLLDAGILPENILTYDLDYDLKYEYALKYDAIYFCGGTTKHLIDCINKINFKDKLNKLVENGLVYIGVSAGSVAASNKYPGNLGYINFKLDVHCEKGSACGILDKDNTENIYLTDKQAIWICGENMEIIEYK